VGHNVEVQTVVETRHYALRAEKLLSDQERCELIDSVAAHPLQGDLLVGTGGLRKFRFAKGGRGKSGGVRVIYYYGRAEHPLFLLEVFGKNEKANLSKAERNAAWGIRNQ
jgi:hypothetical protein